MSETLKVGTLSYEMKLDTKEYKQALKQVSDDARNMARSASSAFSSLDKSAKHSGQVLGSSFSTGTRSAKKELDGLENHSKKTFTNIGKEGKKSSGLLKGAFAGGVAFTALSASVLAFGKSSVEAFKSAGSETMGLQRLLGGTAEDMSGLRDVAKLSGVDVEQFGKSMGLLSRHLVANDKPWKSLGVNAYNANGTMKSMPNLLEEVSDKFAKMESGPAKTALALSLFGRSGTALLPFLNKGSAGIEELRKKSEKLGTTLSGKDLENIKAYNKAHREMGLAIEGSKIALGKSLYPVLTKTQTSMATLTPKLTTALTPAFKSLGEVVVLFVAAIDKNMPKIQKFAEKIAVNITKFADGIKTNMPQIKQTVSTFGSALEHVGKITGVIWKAFSALPPGVQTTLATLLILQKTGVINIGLRIADLGKMLLQKLGLMTIQAGVVNVNGGVGGKPGKPGAPVPGGPAAKGGGLFSKLLAFAGAGSALGAVGSYLGPLAFGAAFAFALQQLASGETVRKVKEQKGNPATIGGSYASMGAGGRISSEGAVDGHANALNDLANDRRKNYPTWLKNLMGQKEYDLRINTKIAENRILALGNHVKKLPSKKTIIAGANIDGAVKDLNVIKGYKIPPVEGKVKVETESAWTKIKRFFGDFNNIIASIPIAGPMYKIAKSVFGFADGGLVSGPGTGTSDSIPARLSHGEYVVRADAVRRIGVNALDSINQGYSSGGHVSQGAGLNIGSVTVIAQDTSKFEREMRAKQRASSLSGRR